MLPLAERLGGRGFRVLLTSGTVTSAAVVRSRLPGGALHQFVPFDVPHYVRRFLDHWRPDMAIFAELELWPTTILEARRRGIRLVLVNGRMSRRSFARWSRAPGTVQALMASFDLMTAQSAADAATPCDPLAHRGAGSPATSNSMPRRHLATRPRCWL